MWAAVIYPAARLITEGYASSADYHLSYASIGSLSAITPCMIAARPSELRCQLDNVLHPIVQSPAADNDIYCMTIVIISGMIMQNYLH